MTLEEQVYSLLSADAGVTALVPVDRIKPPGDWQALARPYIVHMPVALQPIDTHEGRAPINHWPFYQVSCFADTYSVARAVEKAADAALSGVRAGGVTFFLRGVTPIYDSEVRIQQIALDFEVFEAL